MIENTIRASRFLPKHRILLLFLLALLMLSGVMFTGNPAPAQSQTFAFRSRSYINPFPQTDRYSLHVIGDYLAAGLASGLSEAFDKDGTIKVVNSTKSSAGLARPDRTNWAADIDDLAKAQPINIAVVMMGINDMRNITTDTGVVRWGTDEWRTAYSNEVDKLIKVLKAKNIAVYWVGLPVMANSKTSEAMALINDIVRERTYISGTKFIDTWSGFTDQLGGFASYGPDLTGQTKRLREPDGVGFTERGNRKLANYVEVTLRRDLAAARSERNIPLAGDQEEQAHLAPKPNPENSKAEAGKTETKPGTKDAGAKAGAGEAASAEAPQGATPAPVDQKPAGKETAAAAQTPVEAAAISAFASGYSPPGETILGDINDGLTGLATVSPISDLNANIGERRLPVTERLYYKTLVKGEALKPKPGRADDFKWPRG